MSKIPKTKHGYGSFYNILCRFKIFGHLFLVRGRRPKILNIVIMLENINVYSYVGPARLPDWFQMLINIKETMHYNSVGTTRFLEKLLFLSSLVKDLSYVDTTSCRFSKLVDFQACCVQIPSHPRGEIFDCTSIFHEKALYLCVLQFWDGRQTSITLHKLSRSSCAIVHFISPKMDHFGETSTGSVKLGQPL